MAVARPLVGGGFFATYSQPVVESIRAGCGMSRAVHSIWFEVLGEHGFPTFFVWVGITIAGAVYARRIIRQATGVPGLEWCVNLAKMAQVSMIAYLGRRHLSVIVLLGLLLYHIGSGVGGLSTCDRDVGPASRNNAVQVGALPQSLALSR